MGIQDLYKIIKTHAKSQILTYYFHELSGLRLAVDISIFLYKYTRTTGTSSWMNQFILLLCTLKSHGIKAVCIFDGPNPPPEKKREQERRIAQREISLDRLKGCQRMRKLIQEKYLPFDKTLKDDTIQECKSLIGVRKGYPDTTDYTNPQDIAESLTTVIDRLKKSTYAITDDDKSNAMKIVKMMGLSAIQADGEAETLCAYLAVKGLVDAVLTEDTDVLAYGTPLMLAFKDFKLQDKKLQGIFLPGLLEELDLSLEEFRDLCILLSCDYNERVRGFPPDGKTHKKPVSIGPTHAYAMIQEYRCLEEICKHVEDESPLIYERCRELFTVPEHIPQGLVPYNKPPDYEKLEQLIKKYNLTIKIPYIEKCYKPAEVIFGDDSSENEEFVTGNIDDALKDNSQDECNTSSDESQNIEIDEIEVILDSSHEYKDESELNISEDDEIELQSSDDSEDKPYYVILCGVCQNDETGKEKCLEAHFKFASEDLYEMYEGDGFDMIMEEFNEWLQANGHEGWYLDDVIETVRSISPEDAIMPYNITK